MAFSKIILNSTTLMDATAATAAAEDITAPKTAMLADGVMTTGTGGTSEMTLLVDEKLTADQTTNIIYDWNPGYKEIKYSIYVPKNAENTSGNMGLIIFTEDDNANQPRFQIGVNNTNNYLNIGHMTTDMLQLIKASASVGGATHTMSAVTPQFAQQNRTGKITRFWLLYGATSFLPEGSEIKIYGR